MDPLIARRHVATRLRQISLAGRPEAGRHAGRRTVIPSRHTQVVVETWRREYNEERPKNARRADARRVRAAIDGDDEDGESNRRTLSDPLLKAGDVTPSRIDANTSP